jgi:hypothetical protein
MAMAFALRHLTAQGDFVTTDEANWFTRSEMFYEGVTSGDFASAWVVAIWRGPTRALGLAVACMGVPALAILSIASKQFDRYGPPVLVACALAVGVVAALGGGDTAVDTVLVGWWEGLEQVGQAIAERERGHCDDVTIQGSVGHAADLPCGRVRGDDDPDYVVLYVSTWQRWPSGRPPTGRCWRRSASEASPTRSCTGPAGSTRPARAPPPATMRELTLLPPAVPSGARADGRGRDGRQQSAGSVLDRHEAQVVPELVRASELPVGQLPEEFDHCRAGAH